MTIILIVSIGYLKLRQIFHVRYGGLQKSLIYPGWAFTIWAQKQISYLVELPSMGQEELQSSIGRRLQSRSEHGLNRVTYWGDFGLKVKFENQYAENT